MVFENVLQRIQVQTLQGPVLAYAGRRVRDVELTAYVPEIGFDAGAAGSNGSVQGLVAEKVIVRVTPDGSDAGGNTIQTLFVESRDCFEWSRDQVQTIREHGVKTPAQE